MNFAYPKLFPKFPVTPPAPVWRPSEPGDIRRLSFQVHRQLGFSQLDLFVLQRTETPPQNLPLFDSRSSIYLPPDQRVQISRFLLYYDCLISFLYLVSTLGIPRCYYLHFRYNPTESPESRAEQDWTLPSLLFYPRWSSKTLDQIDSSWRISLGLSSGGVLASVMGFFQLLSVRDNVIFTSLVVGACVLTWSSTICGFLNTGHKSKFLTPRIAEQWMKADSPNCAFWRLLALPFIFLAWGVLFCFIATIYMSFTGFGSAQPTATTSTAVGGIFVLGISVISIALICNAVKTLEVLGFA